MLDTHSVDFSLASDFICPFFVRKATSLGKCRVKSKPMMAQLTILKSLLHPEGVLVTVDRTDRTVEQRLVQLCDITIATRSRIVGKIQLRLLI